MSRILKVENIEKYYGGKGVVTKAVDGLSFSVDEGEYIGIMGASGSGKTTLLNCIATIDTVTAGRIYIENHELSAMRSKALSKFRREKLGFVFQEFNLLDTLTAYENIALAMTILKKSHDEIDKKIIAMADFLQISHILSKYPYEMSGGEKQRVATARAIITNPALILADEPTGALDSKSAKSLLQSFKALNEEIKSTILMVTHDAYTASHCKRILFIKDGRLFSELIRGEASRKDFFNQIMEVVTLLGGELAYDV